MASVGVGIIGSRFSAELHADALSRLTQADLVAVASRDVDHARHLAGRWGIRRAYGDYRALLDDRDVQIVNLCVPNDLHAEMCVAAARAGKHVIVEKPFCLNLDEADRMIEAGRAAGVELMYAETLCFTPKYVRAKQLVDEGALGKVHLIKQGEKHFGPHADWFWDVERSGGGAAMDLGCHGVEFFRFVMNKEPVVSVWATMNRFVWGHKTRGDDHALIVLEFASGAIGVAEESWCHQGGMDDRTEIHGDRGATYADLLHGNALTTYSQPGYGYAVEKAPDTKGWTFTIYDEVGVYGFPQEMAHFVGCVIDDKKPIETGEDGRAVIEIMLAAYESARTGAKVKLPFRPRVSKPIDLWWAPAPSA
jgi:predicted dehydrogenase